MPYDDDVKVGSFPNATYTLIGICIIVYLCELGMDQYAGSSSIMGYLLIPNRFIHHLDILQIIALFTSFFFHTSLGYLAGNMLFLYLFGRSVEDRIGSSKYIVFYLLCGLIANICYVICNKDSNVICIGAAGAIAGVMAAYVIFNPGAKIKVWLGLWMGTIKVSAIFLILFLTTLLLVFHPMTRISTIVVFISGLLLAKLFETSKPDPALIP